MSRPVLPHMLLRFIVFRGAASHAVEVYSVPRSPGLPRRNSQEDEAIQLLYLFWPQPTKNNSSSWIENFLVTLHLVKKICQQSISWPSNFNLIFCNQFCFKTIPYIISYLSITCIFV